MKMKLQSVMLIVAFSFFLVACGSSGGDGGGGGTTDDDVTLSKLVGTYTLDSFDGTFDDGTTKIARFGIEYNQFVSRSACATLFCITYCIYPHCSSQDSISKTNKEIVDATIYFGVLTYVKAF